MTVTSLCLQRDSDSEGWADVGDGKRKLYIHVQVGSMVGEDQYYWDSMERNILMDKEMGPQFDFGGTPSAIWGLIQKR